jgi:hypothetical protein
VWSDQFPTVKRALLDSDEILSQRTKRQISARLGDRCARAAAKSIDVPLLSLLWDRPGRGVNCLPRMGQGNSDVVYVPRGEGAITFSQHAGKIMETGLMSEIALPIIMYTLPVPPRHFADRARMTFLWGDDRQEAARYIGGNASAVKVANSGGDKTWSFQKRRRGSIPSNAPLLTNKFGCASLFVHPLKLSDLHNKKALTAFLNRQNELFVGDSKRPATK